MRISELTSRLKEIQAKHGDLRIVGGYLTDECTVTQVNVLNKDGCDIRDEGGRAHGVFIQ